MQGQGSPVLCLLSCVNHSVEILEDFLQEEAFGLCREMQHELENGREVGSRPRKGACHITSSLERGPWGLRPAPQEVGTMRF